MFEVKITDDMRSKAHHQAERLGVLKGSITKGKGNVFGFLGEQIALLIIGGKPVNTFDYDLIIPNPPVGKLKIDVKTKRTTVKPLPHYECSVADITRKQDCDYFAFIRVLDDQTKGWFLGMKKRNDYFDEATYLQKGDKDPSNNFIVRANCYNMAISALAPPFYPLYFINGSWTKNATNREKL